MRRVRLFRHSGERWSALASRALETAESLGEYTEVAEQRLAVTPGPVARLPTKAVGGAMGTRQSFEYFLPRTLVRFSGQRKETVDTLAADPDSDDQPKPAMELMAAVECVEQADPEWPLRIAIDGTFFRDREGSIGFTTDRRLTTLSATSTGTASKFTSGAIRFVTSAIAVIATAGKGSVAGASATDMKFREKPKKDAKVRVEEAYEKDCREASENRKEIHDAVIATRKAIVAAAKDAGQAGDNAKALRELLHAMKVLTDLQVTAEAHFSAWRESKKTMHAQDLAFEVPVLSLPHAADVDENLDSLNEDLLGVCWEPFEQLGVFVAVESMRHETNDGPQVRVAEPGFWFRMPRAVWLSIYERPAGTDKPRLVERRRQLVYDASCATQYVSCDSGAWSKKSVSAELDAGSALSKITTSAQGGAGAIGDALAGTVEQVVKGLADAETITQSLDSVRDRDIDRRLAVLEKRKKLLEAQVAADAGAADVTKLAELARLNHEKDLLSARKDVAALTASPAVQTQSANGSDAASAKRIVISLEP